MHDAYKELEERLGYSFKDYQYLEEALTHRSFAIEHPDIAPFDNERLEFVGDSVLSLSVTEALFQEDEAYKEGNLSKLRAAIVCEPTLSEAARSLELGQYLRFGRGEESSGGREKDSNLANAMEAVFAAIYLDSDFKTAKKLVLNVLKPYYQMALDGRLALDYKSSLLELIQAHPDLPKVSFVITDEEGPVHDRVFTAEVQMDDKVLGQGRGKSKKQAEQQAAKAALTEIRAESER